MTLSSVRGSTVGLIMRFSHMLLDLEGRIWIQRNINVLGQTMGPLSKAMSAEKSDKWAVDIPGVG